MSCDVKGESVGFGCIIGQAARHPQLPAAEKLRERLASLEPHSHVKIAILPKAD